MKVLIAEDDPLSSKLLKVLLFKWGYDPIVVADGLEAWKILQQEERPQIAILDWMMPGLDGVALCRRLRELEKGRNRYTYVVILTCKGDRDDIVTGIDAGADEYIVKPFEQRELQVRLKTGRRIIELQTALRSANQKLLFMARLDPLTGSLSRHAILDDLELSFYRSLREEKDLSVVMIDIDGLKRINDGYGRNAGDQVLQDCVRRINACLRPTDSFGRLGSDRFLIILPGADSDAGGLVCRRIRSMIGEKDFESGNHAFPVTVSQSLALWDRKMSTEALIALTEQTLLATKSKGGSRLEKADSGC